MLRQFRQVYGTVRRHFRAIEAACGLSGSHVWMLREISQARAIGLSALAAKLAIHVSTASLVAEGLVRAGLVRKMRVSQDQRRISLMLTPHGAEVLTRTPKPAEGRLPSGLLALPDPTLRSLHAALASLLEAMGESADRDAGTPLAEL